MNDSNDLEAQLRLLRLRRPSNGLEARIFGEGAAAAVAPAAPALRLNWLAPAMAAVFLMCVMFNQRFGNSALSGAGAGAMTAMILSNQNSAAYLPGSFQGDRNTIPADAFDWTNGNGVTSSVSSAHPARARD
jgi:hypothetical protein